MKKILVLVVLALVGFIAYRQLTDSAPIKAYKQFATAWANGQIDGAMAFADGDEIRATLLEKSIQRLMGGVTIQTLHGVRYTIKSEESRDGGVVAIEAQLMVQFDPPGVESAMRASMYAAFVHKAELKKTPAGWKVVAFDPTFQKMDEMPKPS